MANDTMRVQLSTSTVAGLAGATVRQVGYWAQTGLLKPSGKQAAGKGTRRRYTFQDLVALLAVCKLRERGCPLQKIRAAVKYLKHHYPRSSDAEMLARLTLLTDGKRVYMLTDEHKVMEVVTHQHVWGVPLGLLILEAANRVKSLPSEWTDAVRISGRVYHLRVRRDAETGTYTVQCRELPGAIEQGDTPEEAVANGKEAIRSVLTFTAKRRATGTRYVQVG